MKKPIIKEYSEFTAEEREKVQEMWVKHLNEYCPVVEPKEYGCRPCDLGCPCDQCSYDSKMMVPYTEDCVKNGLPITPREANWLSTN